jgi:single-stranded DNA-binding protein
MNNCILMVDLIQDPELRYTSDTQTPIAEMMVQFAGLRTEDPPSTLKVIGWGNLAQEMHERYHQGDRVVIEGRLSMNTVERPEGFKEKRAELTAQRIHNLVISSSSQTLSRESPGEYSDSRNSIPAKVAQPIANADPAPSTKPKASQPIATEADYDDIPF